MSKTHKNAILSPSGRKAMVESVLIDGLKQVEAAAKYNVTPQIVRKWIKRYKSEGEAGLQDRSSRPHNSPNAISPERVSEIVDLRVEGKLTGDHIARKLGMHQRTVSRVLVRAGVSRKKDIEEPEEPRQRYEHEAPGDMIHLDIKKLRNFNEEGIRTPGNGNRHKSANKGIGSQCMHVAVDDHSRYATVSIYEDETAESVTKHLIETYQHYASRGIVIKRVLTDNGSGYKSKMFAEACEALTIKHSFTQPYTPQTNGKAERFIQTLLREWAYARTYTSSVQRNMFLEPFLHMYNWHRPHRGINGFSPVCRLEKNRDNLQSTHT